MIPILHRDDRCVAVVKPPNMLVHKTDLPFDRPPYVLQRLRDQLGQRVYPIHRLDRATAGVLLFALDKEALSTLMGHFMHRRVEKTYLAVVRGYPGDGGSERPLAVDGAEKEARTSWRPLHRVQLPVSVGGFPTARYSLIAAFPQTGRRHQIRRHLKHASHPIVGDVQHGDRHHNGLWRARYGTRRLTLIAHRLVFPHPESGAAVVVEAPPDPELAPVFAQVGWSWPRGALR